jgi:hypothetical protein
MRSENSVGSMTCECGQVMDVRQSKKRGAYFYTLCENCKMDQRTGAPVQNAIWHNATFDAEITRPSNVVDAKPAEPISKPASKPQSEKISEVEETLDDLSFEELEREPSDGAGFKQIVKPTGGGRKVVGCFLVLIGFVGVVWQTV